MAVFSLLVSPVRRPDWRRPRNLHIRQRSCQGAILLPMSTTQADTALGAPRTVAGLVAERLREEIVAGDLPAGSRLRQVEIARRFGVSTTPVREALAALQREGLVRLHPQRGAVVFVPTVEDLREHYEIRAALEAVGAPPAAGRLEGSRGAPPGPPPQGR